MEDYRTTLQLFKIENYLIVSSSYRLQWHQWPSSSQSFPWVRLPRVRGGHILSEVAGMPKPTMKTGTNHSFIKKIGILYYHTRIISDYLECCISSFSAIAIYDYKCVMFSIVDQITCQVEECTLFSFTSKTRRGFGKEKEAFHCF